MAGLGIALGGLSTAAHATSFVPGRAGRIRGHGTANTLDAQALGDILLGSSYLGCGGGGSLTAARELITADLRAGDGYLLFEGRIERYDWQDLDGFLVGYGSLTNSKNVVRGKLYRLW